MVAMGLGIFAALVGLWVPALYVLFQGAWFSAAGVSFVAYWLLMRDTIAPRTSSQEER